MPKTLFFDTETTGLVEWKKPYWDPAQPHMVQLGAILVGEDGLIEAQISTLIEPDGWTIPPEAEKTHGITTDRCRRFGRPLPDVLAEFLAMYASADLAIGHNISFDLSVLKTALCRSKIKHPMATHRKGKPHPLDQKPSFCTMKETADVCKLPGKFGKHKWLRLAEAYKHFTGEDMEDAHDALADTRACRVVYEALQGVAK